MAFNADELTSENTPVRWRIQGQRVAGTPEEALLDDNYKAVLTKAATFTSDDEMGIGNQPGGGDPVEPTPTPVLVTGITVSGLDTVAEGATITLSAAVLPANADDATVAWSSDDEAVATVDASGVVTGVAAGDVDITATANDGSGVSDSLAVTVTA